MTKNSRKTTKKQQSGSPPDDESPQEKVARTPLWQALFLPLVAIGIFFLLLEGGLALFGVKSTLKTEDPFVGFATNIPLFSPAYGPRGEPLLSTAQNKLSLFNAQSFPRDKAANSYRIFTLGGSTTYGRPYSDTTSFSGWLREMLPVADTGKNWEVINAGGISYASYRVANLMEELVKYQPDLFVIYTGHNEFLEERTYSKLRDIPPLVQSTISLLAHTRTWSAMTTALQSMGVHPQSGEKDREQMAGEVDTILDRSAGLGRYTRDDKLRENILEHYRVSLERMASLARSVGAKVIFVTPPSNLKDCTPFKSEHTAGLDPAGQQRSEQLLAQAKAAIKQQDLSGALKILDNAEALDPRYAEILYRRGQVLLAMGKFQAAEKALRQALDEDVCPLRALTPMRQIVMDVAEEQGVGLIDYVGLLERRMETMQGQPIPGEELFLDHVHPTIEANKILSLALIDNMAEQGLVSISANWDEQAIAGVAEKIEGGIDRQTHGQALANLSRVLLWAGKLEDADRLANQALETAGEYQQVATDAASSLITVYQRQGQPERAFQMLYTALKRAPGAVELHLKLGLARLNPRFIQLEEAAANLLLVSQQLPHLDVAHQFFGKAMVKRGRPDIAYANLMEALRINPNNSGARKLLEQIRPLLGSSPQNLQLPTIYLDIYPGPAPRRLVQLRRDAGGRSIADGIEVEFHENGRLKSFRDFDRGVPSGLDMTWGADGRLLSRVVYRQGVQVNEGSNQ